MKKALLLVLAVVACSFLLGNAQALADIFDVTKQGATLPLLIACALMVARHVTQAISYKASFEAVGFKGHGLWGYIVLIFSLVFINTFCLFSGATGVAFIVDDAHRKGADLGKATSGAILSQIGYFAAILVISIIGFVTMMISGNVNWMFVVGALVLAGTLLVLSSLFLVGYNRPRWLYSIFARVQVFASRALKVFRIRLSEDWGSKTADSFAQSARIMANNPLGTLTSVAWASFSAILNMMCLVSIGFAFGVDLVAALVGAFAIAAISVILSPTPQGIGVVEAAIAAVLTAAGASLASATAIALVYRGIMFWIPFCIGAVLLSQSGFFKNKKNATQEQRDKDVAWISGTLVGIIGLVNVGLSLLPSLLAPYHALVDLVNFSAVFVGWQLVVFGMVLIVLALGLILRFRTCWAITTTVLILTAGIEVLYFETLTVALACIALTVWMFIKRGAFDRPMDLLKRLS